MLAGFGVVFLYLAVAVGFVAVTLIAAAILRYRNPSGDVGMAYECGEVPVGNAWVKFNLRFYVVALIFLVFDVEAALLLPWAVVYKSYPEPAIALAEGLVFLLILGAGLAYVWAKGDLEWIKPEDRRDNLEVQAWKRAQAGRSSR